MKLLEAEVTVVSDSACAAGTGTQQCVDNTLTGGYSGKITDRMLCAIATGRHRATAGGYC